MYYFSSEYSDFVKGDFSRREAGRTSWKEVETKIQSVLMQIVPEVFPDEKSRRKFSSSCRYFLYFQEVCIVTPRFRTLFLFKKI